MNQNSVTKHFDELAPYYDAYKHRNLFYYYSILKRNIKKIIPKGSRVLDYGCGTGEILKFVSPTYGVGYDPSQKMVKIASNKFKNFKFVNSTTQIKGGFDYIILADVVEHIPNLLSEFKKINKFMSKNTKLVISFVDTSWEWFPKILETLKLKMPEGPHKRISYKELLKITKMAGFNVIKKAQTFSPIKILILDHPRKG